MTCLPHAYFMAILVATQEVTAQRALTLDLSLLEGATLGSSALFLLSSLAGYLVFSSATSAESTKFSVSSLFLEASHLFWARARAEMPRCAPRDASTCPRRFLDARRGDAVSLLSAAHGARLPRSSPSFRRRASFGNSGMWATPRRRRPRCSDPTGVALPELQRSRSDSAIRAPAAVSEAC